MARPRLINKFQTGFLAGFRRPDCDMHLIAIKRTTRGLLAGGVA
jgi:hypothetical protein